MLNHTSNRSYEEIELAAADIVHRIGIRKNLKGYRYLITAIMICCENPQMLYVLSKRLYPAVAMRHGITVPAVQQNIRRAIDTAFNENPEQLCSLFYFRKGKPYVSEVLATAVETLRFSMRFETP